MLAKFKKQVAIPFDALPWGAPVLIFSYIPLYGVIIAFQIIIREWDFHLRGLD